MDSIPCLRRPERRQLVRLGRKSRDPATLLRFLAVAKLTSPLAPSRHQVARELCLAVSTVVVTWRRYQQEGVQGLYDRRTGNGQAKVDIVFIEQVWMLLQGTPQDVGWRRPTWTRELLCLQMKRDGFALVAPCTMSRVLSQLGARLGRPKPIVSCPWPTRRRQRRLAALRRLVASSSRREPVLYEDEVDIHLNPKLGRDWCLRGQQRLVLTPGQNQKRYLAGALDARTGQLHWVEGARKHSALFCQLLTQLAGAYPQARRIHVIVDNYGIHSSKLTQRAVSKLGGRVVLHFLPPYCPDHNRIERVWLDLHANVTRNHRCLSMLQLMREVRVFLRAFNRRAKRNPSLRRAA